MLALDFVEDRETKTPANKLRDAIVQACFRRGLLVLGCGESSLRLCPPLVVTRAEATTAMQIIEAAMVEAGA